MIEWCEWVDRDWEVRDYWDVVKHVRRVRCCGHTYLLYLAWRKEEGWEFRVIDGESEAHKLGVWRPPKVLTSNLFSEIGHLFGKGDGDIVHELAVSAFNLWVVRVCRAPGKG